MALHRDLLVIVLALGTAISLYLYSFHDLMAAPAGAGDSSSYTGHL